MSEWEEKLNTLLSDPDSMARIMNLAKNLSEPEAPTTPEGAKPPPESGKTPPQSAAAPSGSASPLGDLLGGIDPKTIARYLPLIQKFGATNGNTKQLLLALKPFLKEEKQEKVERAANLARLFVLAKEFFADWEGFGSV